MVHVEGIIGELHAFCIRDGDGDLIYAQADELEYVTNNIAEAKAILEALRYIFNVQFPPCLIDTDSLFMGNVLEEVWEPPWSIVNQVEEIKRLLAGGVFQVVHVMREGNKLANHHANQAIEQHGRIQVNSFKELDTQGKKILNSDKLQIPYIRVITDKPNSR